MKKIFPIDLLIGILILLVLLFNFTERISGAVEGVTIGGQGKNEIEQSGPLWYDPAWHYRVPISIDSHSTSSIPNYQVLIYLNSSNFNFNLAKNDGSDTLITDGSGTSISNYWIESWDKSSQQAYIWVLIPYIPAEPEKITIYLYFDNPSPEAPSFSNGPKTFPEFFDSNWCQFPGTACIQDQIVPNSESKFPYQKNLNFDNLINPDGLLTILWPTVIGSPSVSEGILNLPQNTRITSFLPGFSYRAVGFRANFSLGNGSEWGGFINGQDAPMTIIGEITDKTGLYLMSSINDNSSQLGGSDWRGAFHSFEIRWKNDQIKGVVDHLPSVTKTQTLSTPLPLTFFNQSVSSTPLQVDWVYVRQFRDNEPEATLGQPQALVDLAVDVIDSPDPTNQHTDLTYTVNVTNDSGLEARGVVITDTLSVSVSFVSASVGCNRTSLSVVCSLSTIPANSSGNATIKVHPLTDGVITDSAIVGSLEYDPDLTNNYDPTTTMVDSVPPTVTWILPTTKGNIYYTSGGYITLNASAKDTDGTYNSGVNYVKFSWYSGNWNDIALDDNSPYEVQFNSDVLPANKVWAFEVFSYDKAGNQSTTNNPDRQVIWIERVHTYNIYIPLSKK